MTITKEAMIRRFKYLSNTTKTAIKKGYKQKEIHCSICNELLTENDFPSMEYSKTNSGSELFFHHECVKAWGGDCKGR